jgi:DNA-binding NarL/FixJ family response regulator
MRQRSIIIASASKAIARMMMMYLTDVERQDIFITENEPHLWAKVNEAYPRLVMIEDCFCSNATRDLVYRLNKRHEDVRIAVFSVEECHPYTAARFMTFGAESYINMREEPGKVREGIRCILEGSYYFPEMPESLPERYNEQPILKTALTERERVILELTAEGKKNKEIGGMLNISVNTVRNHKTNMYKKCYGHRLTDLLRFGIEQGVLSAEELGRKGG